MNLPSLRYFTQAGGRLSPALVGQLADYASAQHKQFFVMYGQTEATARMAYLPGDRALLKPESIGRAIPDGKLSLRDELGRDIIENNSPGELVYQGENIMLGYALNMSELAAFNPAEKLLTGDIAYQDEDGDFFIIGRKKRFIKLFGQRINLDEVEQLLVEKQLETYCCGDDTKLIVAVQKMNDIKVLRTTVSRLLNVHHSVVEVFLLDELPVTANGKKDYQAIMQLFNTRE
jgi:acyl-coenzyme A synthetase/AMP-(fatty) acid ligase